jgi:hypothetical protein
MTVGCFQSILICPGTNQELLISCTAVSYICYAVPTSSSRVSLSVALLNSDIPFQRLNNAHILSRHELTPAVWWFQCFRLQIGRTPCTDQQSRKQPWLCTFLHRVRVCRAALLFETGEKNNLSVVLRKATLTFDIISVYTCLLTTFPATRDWRKLRVR